MLRSRIIKDFFTVSPSVLNLHCLLRAAIFFLVILSTQSIKASFEERKEEGVGLYAERIYSADSLNIERRSLDKECFDRQVGVRPTNLPVWMPRSTNVLQGIVSVLNDYHSKAILKAQMASAKLLSEIKINLQREESVENLLLAAFVHLLAFDRAGHDAYTGRLVARLGEDKAIEEYNKMAESLTLDDQNILALTESSLRYALEHSIIACNQNFTIESMAKHYVSMAKELGKPMDTSLLLASYFYLKEENSVHAQIMLTGALKNFFEVQEKNILDKAWLTTSHGNEKKFYTDPFWPHHQIVKASMAVYTSTIEERISADVWEQFMQDLSISWHAVGGQLL